MSRECSLRAAQQPKKKLWRWVASLVFALYASVVALFEAIVNELIPIEPLPCLGVLAAAGVIVFALSWLIMPRLGAVFIRGSRGRGSRVVFVVVFVLMFYVLSVYLQAYNPGAASYDTIVQYGQGLGLAPLSNWHPFLHTLLFFKLPLSLGGDLYLIVFIHNVLFSLAFAYMVQTLWYWRCPIWLIILTCAPLIVSPVVASHLMNPWKDMALSICTLVLVSYAIKIACTRGKWLQSPLNMVLFAFLLILATFMRHNAMLFTIPFGLIVMVRFCGWRLRAALTGLFGLFLACYAALYIGLGVQKPDQRTVETIGMPLTIWSNVMRDNFYALPWATRTDILSLASREVYERYETGSFNSIKSLREEPGNPHSPYLFKREEADELTYQQVIDYTLQCFAYAPKESLEAFVALTHQVWGVDGAYGQADVSIHENDYGIRPHHDIPTLQWLKALRISLMTPVANMIFGCVGLDFIILLFVGMSMLSRARRSAVWVLPVACYNLGTMFMLSGYDYRFFFYLIPLWPGLLFLMMRDTGVRRCPKKHYPKHIVAARDEFLIEKGSVSAGDSEQPANEETPAKAGSVDGGANALDEPQQPEEAPTDAADEQQEIAVESAAPEEAETEGPQPSTDEAVAPEEPAREEAVEPEGDSLVEEEAPAQPETRRVVYAEVLDAEFEELDEEPSTEGRKAPAPSVEHADEGGAVVGEEAGDESARGTAKRDQRHPQRRQTEQGRAQGGSSQRRADEGGQQASLQRRERSQPTRRKSRPAQSGQRRTTQGRKPQRQELSAWRRALLALIDAIDPNVPKGGQTQRRQGSRGRHAQGGSWHTKAQRPRDYERDVRSQRPSAHEERNYDVWEQGRSASESESDERRDQSEWDQGRTEG